MKINKRNISSIFGIILILTYFIFTFSSIMLYPGGINPLEDYISYLGDYTKNPMGALLYNIGVIITGVLLYGFFYGFNIWYTDNRIQVYMVKFTQFIGFFDATALFLVGVFENGNSLHGDVSSAFFIINLAFLVFTSISFFPHPSYYKTIGIFGIGVALFNFTYVSTSGNPIIEWITVFTALTYVGLIVFNIKNQRIGYQKKLI
jgi:hypothetical membrane protein